MKKILILISALQFTHMLSAQDVTIKALQSDAGKVIKSLDSNGWRRSGNFMLNLNQGSLQNWAAGGEQNTLGINAIFNYSINFKKDRHTWDNYFDVALGFQNASSFRHFRKTDDRIDITSKYGYKLSKKWYAAGLVNFNTQALIGYDYSDTADTKISNFLTPGKALISAGFDYRPNNELAIFISPLTTRWILKKDNSFYSIDKFGVPALKRSYNEIGAYLTTKYTKVITQWASYTGRLDLFSNYKRKPQNIDVFFTNLLSMKFNKWLGSTISLDMIYDDDVLKKTQLKEILGIGLNVKL